MSVIQKLGVMLTAQGPFINMRVGAAEWVIALSVGLLLYAVLAVCLVVRPPVPGPEAGGVADAPLPASEFC